MAQQTVQYMVGIRYKPTRYFGRRLSWTMKTGKACIKRSVNMEFCDGKISI